MQAFTDFMRSRLPETMNLPYALVDLFDWIDDQGLVFRDRNGNLDGGCLAFDRRLIDYPRRLLRRRPAYETRRAPDAGLRHNGVWCWCD